MILLNVEQDDLFGRGRVRVRKGVHGPEAIIFKGSMEAALMLDSFDEQIYVRHAETCEARERKAS
ncbi:MAG: hypothetical protein AAF447_16570 [Myxococcota bacterium]